MSNGEIIMRSKLFLTAILMLSGTTNASEPDSIKCDLEVEEYKISDRKIFTGYGLYIVPSYRNALKKCIKEGYICEHDGYPLRGEMIPIIPFISRLEGVKVEELSPQEVEAKRCLKVNACIAKYVEQRLSDERSLQPLRLLQQMNHCQN